MNVKNDEITLQVNYSSKKAEEGIKKLTGALKNLRNTLGNLNIRQLVNDINRINDGSENASNGIDDVADSMQKALMPISEINAKLKETQTLLLTTSKGSMNDFLKGFKDNINLDFFKQQADAIREMQQLSTGTALSPITQDVADGKILQVLEDLSGVKEISSEPVKEITEAIEDVGDAAEEAKKPVSDMNDIVNEGGGSEPPMAERVRKTSSALKDLNNALKKTSNQMARTISSTVKGLPIFKKHTNVLNKLALSFKRIVYYRVIRSIIREISQAFQEGTKNVALYSKALNGLDSNNANGAMSELATTSLFLKNSIGAACIPILNALIPALNTLADAIVNVINLFNQLFSAIAGKSTYTKAKKYAVDYADSLDKASGSAKDLKNSLLGIDELNVIDPTSGSGGGSGSGGMDYSEMFEEASVQLPEWLDNLIDLFKNGDYEGLGKALAELIINALKSIDWDYIKSKAGDLGRKIAEFFNGLFDPELFYEIGKAIAEALNTAIEFAYEFITTFDWEKAGLSAAELVNGFIETFDAEKFGRTVFEAIKGALDLVTTFFEEVHWDEIGQKIMDFISAIDWDKLVLDIKELGTAVFNAAKNVIKGMFTGDDGKIDLDKIKIAFKAVTVLTTAFGLTQMIQNALPALSSLGVKAAILVAVATISFEGGLTLGQLMAKNGLIPENDSYWYETFSFDTFFDSLTLDFDTTFQGIIDMLTDFKNNPVIAVLGNVLAGPFVSMMALVGKAKEKLGEWVQEYDLKTNLIGTISEKGRGFFKSLFEGASDWIDKLVKGVSESATDIGDEFDGLWDSISTGWDDFITNFSDNIYNFFNGFYKGIESFINMVVDALNELSIDIPEYEIAGKTFGGGSIGFNLSSVSFGDLPRFFAKGGFPEQGQLFVANEAGAEYVGGWGNQTAVANNDQIVAGIQSGVASAVSTTLAPYLSQIATNTGVTANKDFSVKIGDRDIARANTRGQRSMGRQLIYTV